MKKPENEIELKIMLAPENVGAVKAWLARQNLPQLAHEISQLGNAYYDTPSRFFAQQKMGLRVRSHNQQYELTLKTQGNIQGGLHIRPEYNLPQTAPTPDFKRLVSHFELPFDEVAQLQAALEIVFSTDFQREKWLVAFQQSQIEIALDQGEIRNPFGQAPICELELELKSGEVGDMLDLLATLPALDGIWFSGLSKAQRGYLTGNAAEMAKNLANLTACLANADELNVGQRYTLAQQLAGFIRLTQSPALIEQYQRLTQDPLPDWRTLMSYDYFQRNLRELKAQMS